MIDLYDKYCSNFTQLYFAAEGGRQSLFGISSPSIAISDQRTAVKVDAHYKSAQGDLLLSLTAHVPTSPQRRRLIIETRQPQAIPELVHQPVIG